MVPWGTLAQPVNREQLALKASRVNRAPKVRLAKMEKKALEDIVEKLVPGV
jgi:hypothetical protein